MRNVLFGMLLGDSSIGLDGSTWRVDTSHGIEQEPYLLWKASLLGCRKAPATRTSGYGSVIKSIRYYNASLLPEVASICLKNGLRAVSDEWLSELDDLSLAIWYQDDGSWGKDGEKARNGDRRGRYVRFSTEGFDHGSVAKLCGFLNDKGFSARITPSKGRYEVIDLNHSGTVSFWKAIAPHVMIRSKIDTAERPGLGVCTCGVTIEPKWVLCHECLWERAVAGSCGRSRLARRFGTTSLTEIKSMVIRNPEISRFWFDLSTIGSAL